MQQVPECLGLTLATLSFHWKGTHDRPSLALFRHAKITNLHELSNYCAPGTSTSPNQMKRSSLLAGFLQSFNSTPHNFLEYGKSRLVIEISCSGKKVFTNPATSRSIQHPGCRKRCLSRLSENPVSATGDAAKFLMASIQRKHARPLCEVKHIPLSWRVVIFILPRK